MLKFHGVTPTKELPVLARDIIKSIVTVASSIVENEMKIGELAQRTGCPVTRIRFYEQKGLLPEPRRSMGGQRNYSQEAVKRLEFITTCRANGMKLECIERFIEFEHEPTSKYFF